MNAREIHLTQEELNRLFRYDGSTGKLYWRVSQGTATAGAEAGRLVNTGYIQVTVERRQYQAHRLIWVMLYGSISTDVEVDHEDGVRHNNCVSNLRAVTTQGNQWNQTKAKGYYWNKRKCKWHAQIKVDGKKKHLGLFEEEQQARQAYLKAKEIYHVVQTM